MRTHTHARVQSPAQAHGASQYGRKNVSSSSPQPILGIQAVLLKMNAMMCGQPWHAMINTLNHVYVYALSL